MKLYDWNRLEAEQLNPRVRRKVIHTETMTIARLELQKSAVVPEHRHENEQVTTMDVQAEHLVRPAFESQLRERDPHFRRPTVLVDGGPGGPHHVVRLVEHAMVL